jgi:hypothetical protein
MFDGFGGLRGGSSRVLLQGDSVRRRWSMAVVLCCCCRSGRVIGEWSGLASAVRAEEGGSVRVEGEGWQLRRWEGRPQCVYVIVWL